ncbi:MATE family efflux transporter [Paenibacillus chungangensis]|uniref:Probable multidrug resistance protein NorM n=1 Tax=Paenibacillus chungangensis TaxID=696535 RepID=A0ABW3HN39_9BACL
MYHVETWKEKIKLFSHILWPIMITQISLYAMNLVDTMMSSQVSTADLAGVAMGSSLWMPIMTGINGILMAVSPIVAQLVGSGRREEIGRTVTQALYVSVLIAVAVVAGGGAIIDPLLGRMGLEPDVAHIALHYLIGLSLGIIPLFASNVLRFFFDAQGFTRISMIIILLAVPFNMLLNYGFIFGNFGLPALGGIGAAYATAITYWIVFIISMWMTFKVKALQGFRLFLDWTKPSWKVWKELLGVGIPIGLSIFFETSIFAVVTLMMGIMFDTNTIAAHQIAFSVTSLIFMIPLSIGMALTIVVGYSVGGGRLKAARRYSLLGVAGGVAIIALCSVILYFTRMPVVQLYDPEPDVAAMAVVFLIIAIIYQLSDTLQITLQSVLRGYKDVQKPFMIAFVSYWIVGIPAGYALSAFTELGPYGFWAGIIIGLTCAAAGFAVRLIKVQKQYKGEDMTGLKIT